MKKRGFRALKVWLTLRQVGRTGAIGMIADDMRLSQHLDALVRRHPEFEAFTQQLSITTFRYGRALDLGSSTYTFFDGHKTFEVLARRMEARPALRVTLVLNIQRKRGDTTAPEQLVRMFAEHFRKSDWPGSSHPSVFYDPRALDPEGPGGVFHAKAVVADEEAVFITSANLTEAALDRNITHLTNGPPI